MKVDCIHCMGVRKVHKIDPATNRTLKNEWWWFCDCALMGNEQEVAVDCGKVRCALWTRSKQEKESRDD